MCFRAPLVIRLEVFTTPTYPFWISYYPFCSCFCFRLHSTTGTDVDKNCLPSFPFSHRFSFPTFSIFVVKTFAIVHFILHNLEALEVRCHASNKSCILYCNTLRLWLPIFELLRCRMTWLCLGLLLLVWSKLKRRRQEPWGSPPPPCSTSNASRAGEARSWHGALSITSGIDSARQFIS